MADDQFDLDAFCAAIEHRDPAAQMRFYASHAEVNLTFLDEPKAARTLKGCTEIEDWIQGRCSDDGATYQVIYHWIEANQIMVTEECRRPDGTTSLTASTGQITDGRITTQSVVRIH